MNRERMKESTLQTHARLTLGGHSDIVVWRNHVAKARTPDGRIQTFGLGTGSADLVGACRVEVTPEHVGRVLGVMFAVELKGDRGRITKDQELWLQMVRKYGVRSGVAKSVEEALAIARGAKR